MYEIIFFVQMTTSDADIEEDTIHCATCGMQVTLKKAMVHMEKCFMKVTIFLLLSLEHSTCYHFSSWRVMCRLVV